MSITRELEALRSRVRALMPRAREDLAALVSYRSVADPQRAPREESARAVAFLENALAELGLELRSQQMPDGTCTVIAATPAPTSARSVLLYGHYDVQPAGDETGWKSPPWTLTDRGGRWYGRGAADSKGNIVAHLTALRALEEEPPPGLVVVIEGSEEWPSEGLETYVLRHPEAFRADAVLVADTGNPAVGQPAITTTLRGSVGVVVTARTLEAPVHSGSFGGAAPDALAALIKMLASLWDDRGNATVGEVGRARQPGHDDVSEDSLRRDANVLRGVDLVGEGSIGERLWLRPSITVLGIDCSRVGDSLPAIAATARARVSMRIPPGVSAAAAAEALAAHLRGAAPWKTRVEVETEAVSEPFDGAASGLALDAWRAALRDAYEREPLVVGEGGTIPLCSAFARAHPQSEIILLGVEEPQCAIHAADESVDPGEIERIALAETLFLRRYASA